MSRAYKAQFCDCGAPAVTKSANSNACARCAALTKAGEIRVVNGVRERTGFIWQASFKKACNDFLDRNGLCRGFSGGGAKPFDTSP